MRVAKISRHAASLSTIQTVRPPRDLWIPRSRPAIPVQIESIRGESTTLVSPPLEVEELLLDGLEGGVSLLAKLLSSTHVSGCAVEGDPLPPAGVALLVLELGDWIYLADSTGLHGYGIG